MATQPKETEELIWGFLPMYGDLCQWCKHHEDCPLVPVFGVWRCTLHNQSMDSRHSHTRMKTMQELSEQINEIFSGPLWVALSKKIIEEEDPPWIDPK